MGSKEQSSEKTKLEKEEQERKEKMAKEEEKGRAEEKKAKRKQKVQPYKLSMWQRLVNIVLGLAFVGLSIFAISNEDLTVRNAVLILAIILLFSGIGRFIDTFYDKDIGGTKRLIRFIISVGLIAIAAIIYILPEAGEDVLYLLLGIGLLVQGSGRMFTSLGHGAYPFWLKLTQFGLGVVSTLIGLMAMLPSLITIDWNVTILLLLVIGFFVSGLSRFTLGLVGIGKTKREKK